MTTIGRRVDDKMRQRCNNNETMGTAQPARWIRRRRCNGSRRIGVGVKGSQGGGVGRESRGVLHTILIMELGSPGFLATRCACLHS
jgi:hypothetical protein